MKALLFDFSMSLYMHASMQRIKREFLCQNLHHARIATNREQKDGHYHELWLQLIWEF
jgi:hypothetical protein